MADNKLEFFLDDEVGQEPVNWRDIELQVSYENGAGSAVVPNTISTNINLLQFAQTQSEKIIKYLEANGAYHGMPFRTELCGRNVKVFDGILKLPEAEITCSEVKVPAIDLKRIDIFTEKASGITFNGMFQRGELKAIDDINIAYIQSTIPNYEQMLMLSITLYNISKELYENLKEIAHFIAEVTGSAGLLTAVVIIKIIAWIIYILLIVIAISIFFKNLLNSIIQIEFKSKKGILVRTLLSKACTAMGYVFKSSIYDEEFIVKDSPIEGMILSNSVALRIGDANPYYNAAIIPEKLMKQTRKPNLTGQLIGQLLSSGGVEYSEQNEPDAHGYPEWTVKELFERLMAKDNAQIKIINNELHYEIYDSPNFKNKSSYVLPVIRSDVKNIEAPDPHSFNFDEIFSNIFVSYNTDSSDENTLDESEGTFCQAIFEKPNVTDPKKILLAGLKDINIQFALAKRKEELTSPEKVVGFLYAAAIGLANTLIQSDSDIAAALSIAQSLNGNSFTAAFTNPIKARIGYLKLSSDFIGVPKFCIVEKKNKTINIPLHYELHEENKLLTSAACLMARFHVSNFPIKKTGTISFRHRRKTKDAIKNSLIPYKSNGNQYHIFKEKIIPLCCEDFLTLADKNICENNLGDEIKVTDIKYNLDKDMAKVDYRLRKIFDNSLTVKFSTDGKAN